VVAPQVMWRFWPRMTVGAPAKPLPTTSMPGLCSPIGAKVDGRSRARWGSLAMIGRPLGVRSPLTPHSLDPTSPKRSGSNSAGNDGNCRTPAAHRRMASSVAGGAAPSAGVAARAVARTDPCSGVVADRGWVRSASGRVEAGSKGCSRKLSP
jgi:hypothetical protein